MLEGGRMGQAVPRGTHLISRDPLGASLEAQWLRLPASTAGGLGSIPGRGTKIPDATQCGKKLK